MGYLQDASLGEERKLKASRSVRTTYAKTQSRTYEKRSPHASERRHLYETWARASAR